MTEHRPFNTAHLPVKLRVEDYLLLDRSGAFEDYAKTELLDGEIFYMNAQHRPHARAKMDLYDAIRDVLKGLGAGARALVEASVLMPDRSVPEPDIVLTSEPDGDGPIPLQSVALIVEVTDTTQRTDLGRKVRIYARACVPEYWVADIEARVLHQMWAPKGTAYAHAVKHPFGQPIEAATVAGLRIDTSAL